MELQHINIKVFVDSELNADLVRFIEIFHRWIGEQSLSELLIDVADYRHVPSGPHVVLIGHEADYAIDFAKSRYGLRYNRKSPVEGTNGDRVRQALSAASHACQLLETEIGDEAALKFSRTQLELTVNDRALAPNTAETFQACRNELHQIMADVFGHDQFNFNHLSDSRSLFGVEVTSSKPYDLASFVGSAHM